MVAWSGRPAYAQVADELRREIRAGQFPPGSQLPSYQALVKRFEVSITVVRSAVRELKTEGLVSTHQGKGSFVCASRAQTGRADLGTIVASVRTLRDRLAQFDERLARIERVVLPAGG
jgi:DNA-binding GntR family transcriptional regulator